MDAVPLIFAAEHFEDVGVGQKIMGDLDRKRLGVIQGRAGAARANNGLTEYACVSKDGYQLRLSPADHAMSAPMAKYTAPAGFRLRHKAHGENAARLYSSF